MCLETKLGLLFYEGGNSKRKKETGERKLFNVTSTGIPPRSAPSPSPGPKLGLRCPERRPLGSLLFLNEKDGRSPAGSNPSQVVTSK